MEKSHKSALITGAARGIGRAIARRLSGEGWQLTLVDRDDEALRRCAEELDAARQLALVVGDVAEEQTAIDAIGAARERFGALSALVNNAGIMLRKPVTALTLEEWKRVLATNLTAAFLFAREAASLLADGGGAIVNIASTRALMSEPDTEAYGASKGGLVALTHNLAISLGPDVRVNAISPGWIDLSEERTDEEALTHLDHAQHPAGRVGRPEDVAALVAYLIGPESGFVTGANFVVDGGMTRKMIYVE